MLTSLHILEQSHEYIIEFFNYEMNCKFPIKMHILLTYMSLFLQEPLNFVSCCEQVWDNPHPELRQSPFELPVFFLYLYDLDINIDI